MTYMKEMWEASLKIVKAFEEGRYTDKNGVLWVGIEANNPEDDRWVRQDTNVALSSREMQKKMGHELMGWDETPPFVDPYEYAVEWTVKGSDVSVPITADRWVQRGSAERMIEFNERMFPEKMQGYTVRLVKRRKAGPVEDV